MAVFIASGGLFGALLVIWLMTCIRYQIGSAHLKIKLFGLCLRRIRLATIHYVTKRHPPGWSENWWNTLHPNHRLLVVRRYGGLFRNVVITPRNRYVFKADLEKALQRVRPEAEDSEDRSERPLKNVTASGRSSS